AVKTILPNGERELTETFQRFVLHYGFECEFCNPASGNEKGNVESKVKYIRNNFFLPEQTIYQLESFNESLWEKCEKDWNRPHYEKERLIAELFEEEQALFLQLPAKEFECVRYEQVTADKYGFIHLENNLYSTSPRFAKQKVLAKISYHEIAILTEEHELIIKHERLYGTKQKSMKWQPYLTLMAKCIKIYGFL
ncbi:Mu transposase domain-containing protein, partial [Ureibacillus thermophilus]|uniref:Mu transposase domain-containing protein n=1 Tax=Ureibacillus thermophilus TaxID=367743 RepID=UPI003AA7CAF2